MNMMSNIDKVLLMLDVSGTTYVQKCKLIGAFLNNYDEMWKRFDRRSQIVSSIVGPEKCAFIESRFNDAALETTLSMLNKSEVSFCTQTMNCYPEKLRNTSSPPFILYYKGDLSILNSRTVTLSGSRKHSGYGKKVVDYYVTELVGHGITILGGLTIGIESLAHNKTLALGGKTAAIVPSGFHCIYPSDNIDLFNKISEKGVAISEHLPHTRYEKYHFEQRNRLLAALSDAVIFVEVGANSGVFSIFDYANEFSRDIYVIPGEIFSPYSQGTNELIKSYGSLISTSPEDVINSFNTVYVPKAARIPVKLNSEEQLVANLLLQEELTLNEIVDRTKLPVSDAGYILSCMELSGIVRKEVSTYKLNPEVIDEISNS